MDVDEQEGGQNGVGYDDDEMTMERHVPQEEQAAIIAELGIGSEELGRRESECSLYICIPLLPTIPLPPPPKPLPPPHQILPSPTPNPPPHHTKTTPLHTNTHRVKLGVGSCI